jgi:sec-independent protein translocase protein TatC
LEARGRVVKTSKSDDLFESSTMTFGEHLEELRVSLTKALICLAVGMGISLLFADRIVRYVQTPLKKSLEEFYLRKAGAQWEKANGSKMDPTLQEWMAEQKYTPEVVYVDPRELKGSLQGLGASVSRRDEATESTTEDSNRPLPPSVPVTPSPSIPSAIPASEAPSSSSETPEVVLPASKTPDVVPTPPTPMQVSGVGKGEGSVEATGLEGYRGASALQAKDLVPLRLFSRISTNTDALQVTEPFMIYLKAGLAAGLVLASPGIFWYLWGFIASGLYPHERRYVYFFLPVSLFLFLGGAALAFFFIFELVLRFLLTFNESLGLDAAPGFWSRFSVASSDAGAGAVRDFFGRDLFEAVADSSPGDRFHLDGVDSGGDHQHGRHASPPGRALFPRHLALQIPAARIGPWDPGL